MQNPLKLIVCAITLWLKGRLGFERDLDDIVIEDGKESFRAFRKLVATPKKGEAKEPGAIFKVRFRFKNFSQAANRRLSLIPIPLIAAQPGFRSKIWMFEKETGEFQGLYEWDTIEDAEAYRLSFPMKLMKKRAVPGSLTYEIR